jgi:hypothetical protein
VDDAKVFSSLLRALERSCSVLASGVAPLAEAFELDEEEAAPLEGSFTAALPVD